MRESLRRRGSRPNIVPATMWNKLRAIEPVAHVARIAPSWMTIGNNSLRAGPLKPSMSWTRIRCPVDETGRNSVMPSTIPRSTACRFVQRSMGNRRRKSTPGRLSGRAASGQSRRRPWQSPLRASRIAARPAADSSYALLKSSAAVCASWSSLPSCFGAGAAFLRLHTACSAWQPAQVVERSCNCVWQAPSAEPFPGS